MATETTTLPAVIDTAKVQAILSPLPEILSKGRISVEKATDATQALLDTIEAEGMTAELDVEALNLIKKLEVTKTTIYNNRINQTRFMDDVKKLFTSLESSIETLKTNVQKHRDDYAKAVATEQRKAQELAAKQIAKDKEAAAIRAEVAIKLQAHMNDYSTKEQQKLLNLFEGATLDNIDETRNKLSAYPCDYPLKHFDAFKFSYTAIYHLPAEVDIIVKESKKGFSEFAITFRHKIVELREGYVDQIPSKRIELEALKAAQDNEAEKARLEAEAAKRKQQEQERIKQEAENNKAQAETAARTEEAAQNTQTLFDAQDTIAEVPQHTGQVRTGYEIEVKRPAGYMQIANFYFEKEGLTITDMEKLGRKSLNQMKTFAEAYALKNGETIQSPYLVYNETFKAVNKA